MPKQVDYEDRRRQIAEAVSLLISRSGMEAVSLRDVAAQADVSMGAVQRCFRTKDEMLLFALEHISRRVSERANTKIAASSTPQSASTLLTRTLSEIALVEEESRAEAHVWLAFVAQAATSEQLAKVLHDTYAKLHDLLTWLIRFGQDTNEMRKELDPGREAHTLLALADGLTAHVLVGHHTPESALAVLERHTSQLATTKGPSTASPPATGAATKATAFDAAN
ncbi:TetR/AcrR family transcriptional regulator [Streptomyces europaeiscabiei]|uniref:TetR/AcrR family transcriptional regulator n=2 Tax=Streptomyces europaeiscabiei TaxID=146819 RepID=A0ABU4NTW9_9ACTN|nr:TetR/AcrR family transcriptional regulator [Streptomyces europaeiscabiei]MDX2531433.1 TetR/AcrR family transcriptional regulator [Streptomyces europaeiscabiei]MDX2757392.1 TetR/AcrR family transcriptional regulator [Streptomyces europaeiscabiei]MDX2768508.1 TetR/AcrR family transcriptional regulator [Streptomyces europaeiscabiei]MDX3549283.1 TetR/AcrR family transcriptional regulator [Streptomyces europaeiscabiei]MDX3558418.1 TetR/AcrR family transcriptional regulator [Streptomyces europaei